MSFDVVGGAPHLCADAWTPLPWLVDAVLAEAVEDGAVGGLERVAHLAKGGDLHGARDFGIIRMLGLGLLHAVLKRAQVVLEEVDTPGGVGLRVLRFVAEAAFITRAGLRAGRGVDAELEALGSGCSRRELSCPESDRFR